MFRTRGPCLAPQASYSSFPKQILIFFPFKNLGENWGQRGVVLTFRKGTHHLATWHQGMHTPAHCLPGLWDLLMIYSQQRNKGATTGVETHGISLNFEEREFCGKEKEKEWRRLCCAFGVEANESAFFPTSPFPDSDPGTVTLFLGEIYYFWIIQFLNDFTTISHLIENLRAYKQDITLGLKGMVLHNLKQLPELLEEEEHVFYISLDGQEYFFRVRIWEFYVFS